MGLSTDVRGAITAKAAVTIVVALMVFGLLAAVGLPVAIDAIEDDTTDTLTQDVNTDYDVNAELVSNVTSVTVSTTDTATIELNDTRTAGTTSKTIDNGTTETYSLDGGDVNVTVNDVDDTTTPNQSTVEYSYAPEYAYGGAASSIWNILGLAIVLAAFLYVIGIAVRATNSV